jgi:transketolase
VKTLKLKSPLHPSPKKPQYSVEVKNSSGENVECADPNVTRALVAIMDLHAVNGGAASHWGGPAAMAEAMSAVHSIMFKEKNWFEHYNFVNDIGHAENGIYALRANWNYGGLKIEDLWKFRSIESKLTGHGESHLYPDGVLLSNGPLSSAVPQAQGLAIGDKVAANDRITICVMSDGAAMEGEAKESFSAIPGLAAKGKMNPFVLIISDNNTKLSGRIDEDSFSMTPSFNALESMGWSVTTVSEGNDLGCCYVAIEKALQEAKNNSNKPIALIVKTVKGFGVEKTAKAASGGHGFPIKAYSEDIIGFVDEIFSNETPQEFKNWAKEATIKPVEEGSTSSVKKEKMQAGLARGAINAKKKGYPVYSVSSDLQGSTGMAAFQKEYPEASLDVGIAESNMVSTAAGLSKVGFIPIVDTFAAFGVTKGNLPLIMSSLSQAPVIAVFSHAGFQDAADGASHQSLTYLAATSAIPHVKVVQISCSQEGEELMYQAIEDIAKKREAGKTADSYLFFVGRENFPVSLGDFKYKLGEAQTIKKGKDGYLISAGPTLHQAIAASEKLEQSGKEVGVINFSSINFSHMSPLISQLKDSGTFVTVEDHQLTCGLGSQLVHALHQNGYHNFKSISLGVNGEFGQSAYQAGQLYEKHGLDSNAISEAYLKLV